MRESPAMNGLLGWTILTVGGEGAGKINKITAKINLIYMIVADHEAFY